MSKDKAFDAVMALAEPRTKQAATQEQLEAMKRLSLRDAVAEASAITGLPRREVYARALVLQGGAG